ncbi:hypothetical protein CBS147332_2837 [Penicillium roqueforti]|nr:hypothetical protein CBS147332_2837 [Penicillium roqueforti]KAI3125223.1 hypothetical protein CBS147331_217 [Penicillium roqueforti]
MKDNILVAVFLAIALVTPAFAWLFYVWYRSHLAQLHQEGRIINRRNQDRAQANYEPANGDQNAIFGPYFTPRGWVRPKARRLSHGPPQYVNPRQPSGNPNPDQPFQGQTQASTHSPQMANQQPNPLSKRQQRKQRALQNKQRQQQERHQRQGQDEQQSKQNQQSQPKQKYKNQGQNHQKPHSAHSPNAQEGHDEQNHEWGDTEAQNDQTNNHGGGGGWGDDDGTRDNQHNTGQNEDNNDWGNDINNDQGDLVNNGSHSPRRDNHNSPREKSPQWDNEHYDDHRHNNGTRESNEEQHHHNGWSNDRPASPHQASRNEADPPGGWGQDDNGAQQNSHPRSNYSNEDRNRHGEWGNDDAKIYKKGKDNYRASSERRSRDQSSPNRDWGQNDHKEWDNSRGHEEEYHGGGSSARSQGHNVDRDKKKKKERWVIELEENEKRQRRSQNRERSDAAWENRSQASGWKEKQEW